MTTTLDHDDSHDADAGRVSASEVIAQCEQLGFALAGVCDLRPSRWRRELEAWLGAGRNGSMAYLERNTQLRLEPAGLLAGARCAIMVADQYAQRGALDDEVEQPGLGRIARYARGRDYHKVIKKRLFQLCDHLRAQHREASFRAFCDTAPVLERELATEAGLGWIGKHTLMIHPRIGSFVLLGGVMTTLDLMPQPMPIEDHCGSCTRCIDACPTGCISPYSVDASRCVSYLTIEHRGRIDPQLHEGIGDWLFGCDICQEVCPHNSPREQDSPVGVVHEAYEPRRSAFDLLEVLGWDEEQRRSEIAGTALTRATLTMFKRNALIAAGASLRREPDAQLRARIVSLASEVDEPDLVQQTARDVLDQLGRADSSGV